MDEQPTPKQIEAAIRSIINDKLQRISDNLWEQDRYKNSYALVMVAQALDEVIQEDAN